MNHVKKCQICGKRASIFLTQIINGKASELALCEECAREKGLFDPQTLAFAEKFFPEEFRKRVDKLVEELGVVAGQQAAELDSPATGEDLLTRCPVCNFSLEDYRKTGRLGCPDCYRVFTKEIHGADDSTHDAAEAAEDTIPASPAVLKHELEEQLKRAVAAENYEEAARLRDKIRGLGDQANQ